MFLRTRTICLAGIGVILVLILAATPYHMLLFDQPGLLQACFSYIFNIASRLDYLLSDVMYRIEINSNFWGIRWFMWFWQGNQCGFCQNFGTDWCISQAEKNLLS